MISVTQLRDYPLFTGLSDDEIESIVPCLSRRTFARGAYLYYPGSPSVNLYLIESGLIRLFFSSDSGQEFLLTLVSPRSVVGLPLLREDQSRIGGASALQPSTVLVMSQNDMNHLIERYPRFMHNIYREMDAAVRMLMLFARGLATLSLQGRVASMLLVMTQSENRGVLDEVELPLSQTEIATWVGASRGALNRALSRLQQLGLIQVDGQKFLILDRLGLQRMTEDLLIDQE